MIDVSRAANGAPRGKGWHVDRAPTAPDFGAFRAAHVGAGLALVDMVPLVDRLRDQTITSMCVGFALARALHVRAQIERVTIPYPSQRAIYTNARQREALGAPLVDQGCQPAIAIASAIDFGIVGDDRVPFDEAKVNDPMPWDVYQAGADARLAGAYRLVSSGAQRVAEVRQALAMGYPVVFGMDVDRSFENVLGSATWHGMTGPSVGKHMQCIIHDPRAPADAFTVAGSWSGWGYGNGLVRVGSDYIGGGRVSDLYVVTIAPRRIH